MIPLFIGSVSCLSAFFHSRYNLGLEILALQQQLRVLGRKQPRPRLHIQDRIFWVLLPRLSPSWRGVLVILRPKTVVACRLNWVSVVLASLIAVEEPW